MLLLLVVSSLSLVVSACAASTREDIIRMYFSHGYSYNLIVCFLYFVHGISMSLRQLKRILRRLNLRRRHTTNRENIQRATALIVVTFKQYFMCQYNSYYRLVLADYYTASSWLNHEPQLLLHLPFIGGVKNIWQPFRL